MSFIAKFNVEETKLNVLHCGFGFTQVTDASGKPNARPQGGKIKLILESTGETELFDWMINATQTKSGSIIFSKRDSNSTLKTLKFIDAHCVEYYETFDHADDKPMQILIIISARELKLNGSEFKNNWPD